MSEGGLPAVWGASADRAGAPFMGAEVVLPRAGEVVVLLESEDSLSPLCVASTADPTVRATRPSSTTGLLSAGVSASSAICGIASDTCKMGI